MIHNNKKIRPEKAGYTLVEILVVMVISFIVLGGVYMAITSESIELDKEEMIIDMQLNARAAIDLIASDIRKAGFLSCGGSLAVNTVTNAGTNDPIQALTTAGVNLPILQTLKGTANIDYLGTPLAFVNNVGAAHAKYQEDTDVITVRYLSGDITLNTAMADPTISPIDLDANSFVRGDILYITDCQDYSLFQKTNCSTTNDPAHAMADSCPGEGAPFPSNTSQNLGTAYGFNARVYEFVINTYFVRTGAFSISKNDFGSDFFINIEDLQFQYKCDLNNNNDLSDEAWTDVPGCPADQVGAVRIFVLARSEQDFSYTNTNTYDYPNSPYYTVLTNPFGSGNGPGGPPADNRYRYLASAVVMLRNADI